MTEAAPHPRRWAGLAVLSLSLLVVVMDLTILNVALPDLATDLRPTSVELLWIVDVYSLVVAGLLVTASALGDRLGRRRVLVLGYAMFAGASALIVVADSPAAVIAVRGLLGVGGALIMPTTLSMIRTMFTDPRERGTALGLWAAVAGAGAALGPIVGGALVEAWSWHAAFLVNVPLMGLAAFAALALLPESRSARPAGIDATGVALSLVGAGLLMYALKLIGKDGLEPLPVALGAVAIAALAAFVRHCRRSPEPMLDLRLLGVPGIRAATLTAMASMVGLAGVMLLGAQWLQLVEGMSPLEAGIALLPAAVGGAASSMAAPALARRIGERACLAGGLAMGGLGLLVLFVSPGPLGYAAFAVTLGLTGVASGSLAVASGVIMSSTPADKAGSAAAIEETSYEFGSALGVTIVGSAATLVYGLGLPDGAPSAARESLAAALEVAGSLGVEGAGLAGAATAAFTDALGWAGLVGAVVMGAAALAVWRMTPGRDAISAAGPATRASEA